jgi:hypothetical protein
LYRTKFSLVLVFSMDYSKIQQLENGAAQVEPTLLEGETTGCVYCFFAVDAYLARL